MSILHGLKKWVALPALPQDCLLCGAGGAKELLCPACAQSLPPLPAPHCPVCAAPTPGGEMCGACLKAPPAFDATHALWRYAFPVDKLVQALKFQHRLALAGWFAKALHANPSAPADLMIPLPLSKERLRARGFNQALEIARPLAKKSGAVLLIDACIRCRDTPPQSRLPWQARQKNVRHAFECRVDLGGKSVEVIDDVMTTGATLNEFARILKQHGAARVTNRVLARTLKN